MNKKLIEKYNLSERDIFLIEDYIHYGYSYSVLERKFTFEELEVILDSWEI